MVKLELTLMIPSQMHAGMLGDHSVGQISLVPITRASPENITNININIGFLSISSFLIII
jgi:hypothetical protein